MGEETIGGKGLPIIKNDKFGLTEKDVKKILKETKEDLKATRKALNGELAGRQKEYLEFHLKRVEAQLQALSTSPRNVLVRAKYFYERTAQLGRQGMNEDTMLDQLVDEFSDIGDYYGLLRLKPWGYTLGQAIFATRSLRQIRGK